VSKYSLTHVSDTALARDLAAAVAHDRASTANLLAHIAEFDARKLYLPAAHPSMYSYCVHELRLGEQAAFKRIRAARAARQFPAIFTTIADGRLNLSAVVLLAPHLTPGNAEELLMAAANQSQDAIERLLAERFPRPDVPTLVSPLGSNGPLSSRTVEASGSGEPQLSSRTVEAPLRQPAESTTPQRLAPLSPQRYALQTTVDQETYDLLRKAQTLLGHQLQSGDIALVLARALELLVHHLERRKFAAAKRPSRHPRTKSSNPRHIPAAVKRAVRERDQDQCTFRSEDGRRCPARTRLEFDHVDPVARGGQATVVGIRLRCRAHNQYDAERAFGAGFMERKREQAREMAAASKAAAEMTKRKQAADEVIPYLRTLGFRADESKAAAALCEPIPEASLERRVKVALSFFANRHCTRTAAPAPPPSMAGA
jgi:hypothetical protein